MQSEHLFDLFKIKPIFLCHLRRCFSRARAHELCELRILLGKQLCDLLGVVSMKDSHETLDQRGRSDVPGASRWFIPLKYLLSSL